MSAAKSTAEGPKRAKKPTYRLPRDGGWANAWRASAALGALGLVACWLGYSSDPHRFAFSWLFAFMTFLAIGLGSLFFVLAQHLTGAGWGVTIRRTAEMFMAGLVVFPILFLPIAMQRDELYPWMHFWREHRAAEAAAAAEHAPAAPAAPAAEHSSSEGILSASVASAQDHPATAATPEHHAGAHEPMTARHAAHEEVMESKLWWLDGNLFLLRALIYFAIWLGLAFFFYRGSTRQDVEGGLASSKRMETFAPAFTFLFAFSLTFAAFDWMMSLEPTWFSTIFGVQYWSVCVVSSLATIIVTMHGLRSAGVFGTEPEAQAITQEHFHDMGKLLFGFLVFWAYVSFSQFMLIWYASIPEETTYYHLRAAGGWRTFSYALLFVHFIIPFFLIISRNVKRRVEIMAFGAAWLLVTHVIEVFWLVMPYVSPGDLSVHWLDFAALFAVGGIYLTAVLVFMGSKTLIPVSDPRLARAMHLEVG